jgi:hypothetical protein
VRYTLEVAGAPAGDLERLQAALGEAQDAALALSAARPGGRVARALVRRRESAGEQARAEWREVRRRLVRWT